MNFIFEQIRTGGDRNFGYLIGDRKAGEAAVVDPSYSPRVLVRRAKEQGLAVKLVINTHGHSDHINGNAKICKMTGAHVAAHVSAPFSPDIELEDGGTIPVGSIQVEIVHVPGHTDDHVVLYLPEQKVAVTGDHLFVGKIGGTATEAAGRREYESFKRLLEKLPDDTTIWPGHDYGCRPSSTIFLEKATNPFLLAPDVDAFLDLKRKWAVFKAKNGLR